MRTCHGCSLCILSSLCMFSVAVVFMLSVHFCKLMRSSGSNSEFSAQMVELQTKFTRDDQDRPVLTGGFSTGFYVNQFGNSTIRKKTGLSREQKLEQGLARARSSIRRAASRLNLSATVRGDDFDPSGFVYRNPGAFYQSYEEMERRFKVYVYSEGDPPITHDGPCKDIYTIEGRFIHELEHGAGMFRTRDPHRAHVYFLPFSVTWMVKTCGADHFMLACHDWGPHVAKGNPFLYNTSIRILCNANTSEGFNPQKDISLPEIHLYGGNLPSKLLTPPPADAPRPYLAFFAGGVHGPIRPILLHHWKNRDNDLRVYEYLPKELDYYSFMLQSKFCLCPSGHEVASPRIVEAIYAECVPVILSDSYVLPFSDVLRWEAFSIQVDVSEIPRLKEVLSAVSEERYRRFKENLKVVRRHFVLNKPAQRFDVFHMILHSVWLRRININLE
ncbi:hypothetical protein I3843_07G219800 [Carya illinoinensis]|uniref:Exostosin GT47 domain-containing protein n=1 Tax=Carya illinoinensis TaxID=32201 RepID=A0A8T1Q4S5_CARIL|nr:probable glycosyltransferase At5g25310 isoform X2 [Carya illinoinensis]KAG6649634.1 hypothetical protein CIPAW_07G225000 [Carya illinoinensis]KAG7973279.1 hypothetical protein I3843_07G219800 [Carya illinoinensis]